MDVYEVEFLIRGRFYMIETVQEDIVDDLESQNILVTSVRKNGVSL